jgi:hypothetical protein
MYFSFRKQPEPPKPFYRKPAVVSIVLTVIIVFVLGPVGIIFNGMTEELKSKADNDTVILLIKQIKENDARQWKEIERNREQSQKAPLPPKSVRITGPAAVMTKKIDPQRTKLVLTPEQFEKYLKMESSIQVKYKRYLESRGYDTGGLP